jgi:hypothetical protein
MGEQSLGVHPRIPPTTYYFELFAEVILYLQIRMAMSCSKINSYTNPDF